jgi:signal transduction histidine kinase/DNA-binding NarL/FixJ family response regulator
MGSSTRIRILIIAAFIIAGGLLFIGYSEMQKNVQRLVQTVKDSSQPDHKLTRIKEIWSRIEGVDSDVRAYTVTGDESFLAGFLGMKDAIEADIDSLKAEATKDEEDLAPFEKLDSLLSYKVAIYDSLLEISYSKVISDALEEMGTQEMLTDSLDILTGSSTIWQRLFSSRHSRKSIQERADSLISERNARIREFNRNLKKIREDEAKKLQEQTRKELALLASDQQVTASIEKLISELEFSEQLRIRQKARASQMAANNAAEVIRYIVIAGLGLILLLLILVFRDISLANKRRKELIAARNHAEKLARAKEEFMSTMSHEIRTPLTSIIGFSEKLKQTQLNYNQQRYLHAIIGSSDHLLSIVNDVLDFTRVETGKLKFEEVTFKAADIFTEVFDALIWKAEEKNISLNLYIQPIATLLLNGDPVRLRQVLFNLAGNAIKFTSKGTVGITATYSEDAGKAVLLFKVSDTGIGIEKERLDAIFSEFEQADTSTGRLYGGSGLGLAITKRIVEQQGGSITVESNPGIGSVFSVRIPYLYGSLEPRESSYLEESESPQPLKGMKIILAEDDPMIRELQHHSLESLGANVILAEDGRQAVEAHTRNSADLILMDIQMPELTGPEAVKEIRETLPAPQKDVPVIAMTANVLQHDVKRWLQEGMNDFITKPFREQDLLEKINRLMKPELKADDTRSLTESEVHIRTPFVVNQKRSYDLKELINASQGNNEFVKKMINLFLTSSFASVNNLKFHLKQNNWEQLGKTSHRMIGSYKQMGVDRAALMLKEIEETALGNRELGKAAYLVSEVEKESAEVFMSLRKELENY